MQKVLLIDDNSDILAMWKLFLEKESCVVGTMKTAAEFFNYIESGQLSESDIIICDQSLEDGLGTELFEFMLKKNIRAKFTIVSGYPIEDVLSKITGDEMPEVFKKPITLSELKSIVTQ